MGYNVPMQRKDKTGRSKKINSPLLPLLPLLLAATVLQGIIAIFSEIQCPILSVDVVLVLFYFCFLLLELWNTYQGQPFSNKKDIGKLMGWFLSGQPFMKIQLENGKLAASSPLLNQRKLLSVDPASAAAIQDLPSRQIHVLSAGMYCLNKEQTLLSVFDLRTQRKILPIQNEEPMISPANGTYQDITPSLTRSSFFLAQTKDAYQVGIRFLVDFKFDIDFGEGSNPYGFDPAILLKVHSRDTNQTGKLLDAQRLTCNRIQNILSACWQTSLNQVSLLELIPQETVLPSALEKIEAEIQHQLVKDNSHRSFNDTPLKKQLQDFGLRILNLSLQSLWLPEETEIAIQHHWQPQTKQLVNELEMIQRQKLALYRELGEIYALYELRSEQTKGESG